MIRRGRDHRGTLCEQWNHVPQFVRIVSAVAVNRTDDFCFGMANAIEDGSGDAEVFLVPNDGAVGLRAEELFERSVCVVRASVINKDEAQIVIALERARNASQGVREVRQNQLFVVAGNDDANGRAANFGHVWCRLRSDDCRDSRDGFAPVNDAHGILLARALLCGVCFIGRSAETQIIRDADEVVLAEVIFEHPGHLVQIAIMSNPGQVRGAADARLLRIKFPDVRVHHEGRVIVFMPAFDGAFDEHVRKLAQVVAARDGDAPAKKIRGRDGELPDCFFTRLMLVREATPGLRVEFF